VSFVSVKLMRDSADVGQKPWAVCSQTTRYITSWLCWLTGAGGGGTKSIADCGASARDAARAAFSSGSSSSSSYIFCSAS
jgi:hypothetical protein